MNERDALLALNAVPGIGTRPVRKLLEHYGSAEKIFSLSQDDLIAGGIVTPAVAGHICSFPREQFLREEGRFLDRHGIQVVTCRDDDYPRNLSEIADAPVVLYVKGCLPKNIALSIAVVGSRGASFYGMSVAEQFASRLAELKVNIVSGMARGVDTAAHRGALKAKGSTTAVLGCGLNHIYPQENEKLFYEIASSGAVVSEFPMAALPLPYNFPRRNRVISGLSRGVIVVEAAEKSGALITADFALEQGREVYAIPGMVDSPTSQGVHNLIKQGAKLVTCIEDILEDLCPQLAAEKPPAEPCLPPPAPEMPSSGLSDEERRLLGYMTDHPMHIDQLQERYGAPIGSMTRVLLGLELKHLIRQLPGKLFVRKA